MNAQHNSGPGCSEISQLLNSSEISNLLSSYEISEFLRSSELLSSHLHGGPALHQTTKPLVLQQPSHRLGLAPSLFLLPSVFVRVYTRLLLIIEATNFSDFSEE